MPLIEVDFESFKEIIRRRPSEDVSEADVIREVLGFPPRLTAKDSDAFWESEGVRFPVGTVLEHKFRDGRLATAVVRQTGLEFAGQVYPGLSPAGVAVTGHQLNGWLFWFIRDDQGHLVPANSLRTR